MADKWEHLGDYEDAANQTGQVWEKRTSDGARLRLTEHNDAGLTYWYSLSVIRSEGIGHVLMARRTSDTASACYGYAEAWSEVNGLDSWYDEVVRFVREKGNGATMCSQHRPKFACSEMFHARVAMDGEACLEDCDACRWVEDVLPVMKRRPLLV